MPLHSTNFYFSDIDPAFVFDGLFVPTNGRKRPVLELPKRKIGKLEITFTGVQPGAREQSILLALAAQFRLGTGTIAANPTGDISRGLRQDLFQGATDPGATIVSRCVSFRRLLVDAGYATRTSRHETRHTDEAKAALDILGNVQMQTTDTASGWSEPGAHILSRRFNVKTKELYVALNPMLSSIVLGLGKQFVRISLMERNRLTTESAKILHAWLCGHIRLGGSLGGGRGAHVDSLMQHIWGPAPTALSRSIVSRRRIQVRAALQDIRDTTEKLAGGNGWVVNMEGDIVLVSRPKQLPQAEAVGLLPSDAIAHPGIEDWFEPSFDANVLVPRGRPGLTLGRDSHHARS